MDYFNIYAVSILISMFLCIALGIFVYYKNPSNRMNKYYLAFSLLLGLWVFVKFNIQVAENYNFAFFWQKINFVYMLIIPVFFYLSLAFAEKKRLLDSKLLKWLVYTPLIFVIFTYLVTDESGLPYEQSWGWAYDVPSPQGIYRFEVFIAQIWTFILGFASVVMFIYPFFKTKELLKKKQAIFVGIGFVILLSIGIFDYYWGYRNNLPEFSIFGFMFLAIFMGYAMRKYELFSIDPIKAAESIVSIMSDALLLIGVNRKILDINKSTESMLGFKKSELLNKSFRDIFFDKDSKQNKGNIFNQLVQNEVVKDIETVFITKEGNKIPISLSACQIRAKSGELRGIVCIGRDITDRKRTEKELIQHKDELERLNKILSGREYKLRQLKVKLKRKRLKSKKGV